MALIVVLAGLGISGADILMQQTELISRADLEASAQALARGGDTKATTLEPPNLNHLFQAAIASGA